MRNKIKEILLKLKLDKIARTLHRLILNKKKLILINPPYNQEIHKKVLTSNDPIRNTIIALIINSLKITGSMAELGVYRGETSKIIHSLAKDRKLYLFDTFNGFPSNDLNEKDNRFKDVCSFDWIDKNVIIKKGYFPNTAKGLEDKFAFVLIDCDLYNPTLFGLKYFYPRLVRGGIIMIHDYNNPNEMGISKAVNEFMKNKSENIIELPDRWGSIMFFKTK